MKLADNINEDDLRALAQAPALAEQTAVMLIGRYKPDCRLGAVDAAGVDRDPLDARAKRFSLEGALTRVRESTGRPYESEAWVHRGWRALFHVTMLQKHDILLDKTAASCFRAVAQALRALAKTANIEA
jgi:hypothetical protein